MLTQMKYLPLLSRNRNSIKLAKSLLPSMAQMESNRPMGHPICFDFVKIINHMHHLTIFRILRHFVWSSIGRTPSTTSSYKYSLSLISIKTLIKNF